MSVTTGTPAVVDHHDPARERRTLLLGTRLLLAANTMMQLAFIFAYLYLRANNFNGGWRPDGIDDLGVVPNAIALVLQLACLGAAVVALGAARRGTNPRAIGAVALLLAVAAIAVRWWYQYHLGTGFTVDNGTYAATTMVWFSVLLVEVLFGGVWLLSIVAGSRGSRPMENTASHLRAFSEYWAYVLVLTTLVWLLARLV